MKKLLSTMLIAVVAMIMLGTVSKATTKDELKNYLFTQKDFTGTNLIMQDEDKVKFERYLSTHDVTDAQAGEIKNIIEQARAYMNKDGAKSPNKVSSKEKKKELFEYAKKVASVLGLTVTYNASDETLDIYENGKHIETIHWGVPVTASTTGKAAKKAKKALVQTGSSNYGYVIAAGVVLVAGIAFIAVRKSKVNAD